MNSFRIRRLSPINDVQDQESNAGAEVSDIPFYRPSQTSSRKLEPPEKLRKPENPHPAPHVRDLEALIASPARFPLHIVSEDNGSIDFAPLTHGIASHECRQEQKKEEPEEMMNRLDLIERSSESRSDLRDGARGGSREESRGDVRADSVLESRKTHRRGNEIPPLSSPSTVDSGSRSISHASDASSPRTGASSLPALQQKGADEYDQLEPLDDDDIDPGSFDLVASAPQGLKQYSLETRSEQLFSTEHLRIIFNEPSLLLRFTAFLSAHRKSSIPILIYYLDAIKALKAISYSNAIAEALDPISGFDFTTTNHTQTTNKVLEEKAAQAFGALVREDLPAYITHTYLQSVSLSIQRRVTGTLPAHLREASEGLAEVFCLTDPSRPDNPIVFASEEFHRTTQYGMSYVIGRNCRFLQGPKTNPHSVRRFRDMIKAGVEHSEVFLNYRRDGSPFMNLLMCAPLRDSRGIIRYFIGAQVDVSGLVKECSDMESLRRLVVKAEDEEERDPDDDLSHVTENSTQKDEFQELSEMLNLQELDTVRRWGGRMHREKEEEASESNFKGGNWSKPRLLINSTSPEGPNSFSKPSGQGSGRLSGIYESYLLVRPYPSLRILFASPSLRVPGILQSPFMAKIGGSNRVREELTQALADGRGVTAKVKWVSKTDQEGRNRWIHCTPLLGSNGAIGVWMVVIVDDEASSPAEKQFRMAPPIDPKFGRSIPTNRDDSGSLRDFAMGHGANSRRRNDSHDNSSAASFHGTERTDRSASPYSLRI
ncbi:related to nonphototropic hypocotyl protein 1 [Rhynchosporium agropyri]|uniref:Related to nonphototropic hypocotyl protein 1 n=1 Tax=Rhynchosporium agropyri TaxID=914238 RepID=A0A1E1JW99_9HELO|nr:related to nonphototropic hypocotyl protein 1 [Rhynchosporium agropyri]